MPTHSYCDIARDCPRGRATPSDPATIPVHDYSPVGVRRGKVPSHVLYRVRLETSFRVVRQAVAVGRRVRDIRTTPCNEPRFPANTHHLAGAVHGQHSQLTSDALVNARPTGPRSQASTTASMASPRRRDTRISPQRSAEQFPYRCRGGRPPPVWSAPKEAAP
jgi:hypothetical protein